MNYVVPVRGGQKDRVRVNLCEGEVHITYEAAVGRGRWSPRGEAGSVGTLTREEARALADAIIKGLDNGY